MNNKKKLLHVYEKFWKKYSYRDYKNSILKRYYLNAVPEFVQLNITRRCNYDCDMCTRKKVYGNSDLEKEMDFSMVKKIVNKLPSSISMIDITGYGEPTIHPQYFEIIEYLYSKGFKVQHYTNGSCFKLNSLSFLNTIYFSMDEFHYKKINSSSLTREKKLRSLIGEAKTYINRNSLQTSVKVNTVVSYQTYPDIPKIFESCNDLGIDELILSPMLNLFHMSEHEHQKMNNEVMKSSEMVDWDQIINEYSQHNYDFSLTISYPKAQNKGICLFGAWRIVIDVNGKVRDCCYYHSEKAPIFGDLLKEDFDSIYYGKHMTAFRNAHIKNLPIPVCDQCRYGVPI